MGQLTMEYFLILSGERKNRHYQIELEGGVVELTHGMLTAFLALLLARGTSAAGYVFVPRLVISRLRQAIDRALGPGAGKRLIETGCGEEYRLAIPADQLLTRVAVEAGFLELAQAGLLPPDQVAFLERLPRASETRVKLE